MDDNEPLPNPFKLPVMSVEIQKELQTGKLTVRTMKEVAKLTVNAMRFYTTHPQRMERSRVARQLIKMYFCLADQDSNVPEVCIGFNCVNSTNL